MRSRFPLISALFLVSGATGLLYEVAFSKLLGYIFGATAYAVSTVLAAFMGGLALGAFFGGRFGARVRRPLVAYGALEIIVGAACALSPWAFDALTSGYVALARGAPGSLGSLTVARAALTTLIVVVPTMAMGATLPLLSRIVSGASAPDDGSEEAPGAGGRRLATLYAINTTGGAVGALSSAYLVLPTLGIRGTMHGAAVANVLIGALAIFIGRRTPLPAVAPAASANGELDDEQAVPATDAAAVSEQLALSLAFASGFLVFAAEVVQTHLLALLIGNSAYAFGLMLAVFLVCLALGAARAPAFAAKHGAGALARGLGFAALSMAVTLPLWDQLPRLFVGAGKVVTGWEGRELCRAIAALGILALPTVWMGSTFPLLLQRVASRRDVAARVGRLTVANTIGTIVGSIATGYFVLPRLGSQRTLAAVAAAFGVAALVASANLRDARERPSAAATPAGKAAGPRAVHAIVAAALVLAFAMPRWDMATLTNGANVYFTVGPPPDSIDFVREDVHGGVTTVVHRGDVTTMYTNGKFQGDDGPEMAAQRRFAHFPSLFVPREGRALVIGLGTGTTLGTIAGYPYERIDVAEISPAIEEAARRFFAGPAMKALDDPRVHLDLNDGRNVLLVSSEPYDLVTIELTSVWFAGAASLYSHEFYELTRSRLTPGGILQQWVQLHHIRRRELATIVRTLRGVFPHVALFVGGSQGILVASAEPLTASVSRLDRLAAMPGVRATLGGKGLPSMLDEMVASGPELDRLVKDAEADGGPIVSTDDNLYLEYATPKGNVLDYWQSLRATLAMLDGYRTTDVHARHLRP